ncbi:MAG: hypothetical protein MJ252_00975 [archaeon]|nr:hypothetical protein [archaeon]
MKFLTKLLIIISLTAIVLNQTGEQEKLEKEAIKNSYEQMYVRMLQQNDKILGQKILFQYFMWTGICLAFVLYFGIMAMIDMPIIKSSILYAKYGISRTGNLS